MRREASGVAGQTACWVGSSRPRILLETAAPLCTREELGQPFVMGKPGGAREDVREECVKDTQGAQLLQQTERAGRTGDSMKQTGRLGAQSRPRAQAGERAGRQQPEEGTPVC